MLCLEFCCSWLNQMLSEVPINIELIGPVCSLSDGVFCILLLLNNCSSKDPLTIKRNMQMFTIQLEGFLIISRPPRKLTTVKMDVSLYTMFF